ncbi:LytR/AlgR family response regulator transcription factor [Spirosoma arcticum]
MDTPISCLVVDDEPLASQLIERFISRIASLHWIGTCTNAVDAIGAVRVHQPALLFLDIEMPELSGLDFLNTFSTNRPQVILTTAYPQYALEGFDYDVTDYLLKPIRFERFVRAINKVHARTAQTAVTLPPNPAPVDNASADSQAAAPTDPFIWVNINKKKIRLTIREIVFLESLKDYTRIHLPDQRVEVHAPLNKLEQLLPPDEFMRINRSYIVRRDAVASIQGKTVELTNKTQLTVGITYRDSVRDQLK